MAALTWDIMRILLVEDDVVLRDVMVRSLTDAGHRVDVAETLEQAEHYWLVQPFDTVLLDLNLPVQSGFEVLGWLRQQPQFKELTVVVFSSSGRPEDRRRAQELGATDYVLKPSSGVDFVEVARRFNERWLTDKGAIGAV